jgi:hypothetical protein
MLSPGGRGEPGPGATCGGVRSAEGGCEEQLWVLTEGWERCSTSRSLTNGSKRGPMLTEAIEIRPNYIHVLCSGPMKVDDFVAALNRGMESAAIAGRRAVLMDARAVSGTLSTVDRFVLGEDVANAQRAHAFVAAIAVVGHEPLVEVDRLAEKVATNRGAVGKVFTELAEAERWIEEHLSRFGRSNSGAGL